MGADASSNRAQQSKAGFTAGERRISATAHITTAHLKLSVAPALLRPVFAALASPSAAESALTAIQGYDDLDPQEQRAFERGMTRDESHHLHAEPPPAPVPEAPASGGAAEKEAGKKVKGAGATGSKQPPQGTVTKSKGRVCWKFAGTNCAVCTCIPGELPGRRARCAPCARTRSGRSCCS